MKEKTNKNESFASTKTKSAQTKIDRQFSNVETQRELLETIMNPLEHENNFQSLEKR